MVLKIWISLLAVTSSVLCTPWWFDDDFITTTSTDDTFIELETEGTKKYIPLHEMGVDVKWNDYFIFQVQAEREVNLLLQSDAGDTGRRVYEITIGGWTNTMSVLRKAVTNGRVMEETHHRPLNGSELRGFWVSWREGRVEVGEGEEVGGYVFLSHRDPFPHPVNYVSVSTGTGATGRWRFDSTDPVIGVWTIPREALLFRSLTSRGLPIIDVTEIVFWLKASNDANIVLSNHIKQYANMYWVSIGRLRNSISIIRKGRMGPDLAHALHTPLSARSYLPFWITWTGGVVCVGEGSEIGRRQFMSWTDPESFEVTQIFVSTGHGSTGHWLIDATQKSNVKDLPRSIGHTEVRQR